MKDTNRDFKKETKFINDFKINCAMLAELIGVSRGNFTEKLHNVRGGRFSDDQKDTITAYLKKMGKAISKL
jgi:hypothetical protein